MRCRSMARLMGGVGERRLEGAAGPQRHEKQARLPRQHHESMIGPGHESWGSLSGALGYNGGRNDVDDRDDGIRVKARATGADRYIAG